MVEKFRQIIGNSAKHCLAFSAGAGPQTILPRISQSTLVQAALWETYCVTKTSNSTRRQRYKHITKLPIHMIDSLHIFTNLFPFEKSKKKKEKKMFQEGLFSQFWKSKQLLRNISLISWNFFYKNMIWADQQHLKKLFCWY